MDLTINKKHAWNVKTESAERDHILLEKKMLGSTQRSYLSNAVLKTDTVALTFSLVHT